MLKPRYLLVLLLLGLLVLPGRAAEHSVLLACVGDVMLSRTVPARITAHNAAWAWQGIAPYLRKADLRFCNLECPVSRGGLPIPKRYSFRADPRQTSAVLSAGRISIVSLANNHTFDYGRAALADTIAVLRPLHITALGAGIGRRAAIAPRVITRHGLKIAFVAYTAWTPEGYLPAETGPALATLDETTLAAELKAAKAGADLLVVSLHWGQEYASVPADWQRHIAHLAIDAGADLIIGHHPHVAQPIEIYHRQPIFYSLGNCIFDRSGNRWSNGLLALIRLSRHHVTVVRQIPLHIEDARPIPALTVAFRQAK